MRGIPPIIPLCMSRALFRCLEDLSVKILEAGEDFCFGSLI